MVTYYGGIKDDINDVTQIFRENGFPYYETGNYNRMQSVCHNEEAVWYSILKKEINPSNGSVYGSIRKESPRKLTLTSFGG